jgi:hypothetical protein
VEYFHTMAPGQYSTQNHGEGVEGRVQGFQEKGGGGGGEGGAIRTKQNIDVCGVGKGGTFCGGDLVQSSNDIIARTCGCVHSPHVPIPLPHNDQPSVGQSGGCAKEAPRVE